MKTLKELIGRATPGPYYVTRDEKLSVDTFISHRGSGLALVDTGRSGDWPIAMFCEWPQAEYLSRLTPQTMLAVVEALETAEAALKAVVAQRDWMPSDLAIACKQRAQLCTNVLADLNSPSHAR